MAYRIVYCEDPVKTGKERFRTGRFRLMTAVCFVLFLLSVKLLLDDGLVHIRQVLFPGSVDTTLQALEQLVAQIQAGTKLSDAVTAFCREIIAGAGLA